MSKAARLALGRRFCWLAESNVVRHALVSKSRRASGYKDHNRSWQLYRLGTRAERLVSDQRQGVYRIFRTVFRS